MAVAALPSDKGKSVALEATAPYGCGVLTATQTRGAPAADGDQVDQVPEGGVPSGDAPTGGVYHVGLLALGSTALLGAGATAYDARRRLRDQR